MVVTTRAVPDRRPAWRRYGGVAGYLVIVALAGLVYAASGAVAFTSDASLLQRFTGLAWVLAGAAAYRLTGLSFALRALLATAGAWLAVDEWLMVHECMKFGVLNWTSPGLGREALVIGYGVVGAMAAVWLGWRLKPPGEALAHGVATVIAVAGVLFFDVAGVVRGELSEVVEETLELLAAWSAIQCCVVSARAARSLWYEALAVAAWSCVCLSVIVWLLKPLFCAARFL